MDAGEAHDALRTLVAAVRSSLLSGLDPLQAEQVQSDWQAWLQRLPAIEEALGRVTAAGHAAAERARLRELRRENRAAGALLVSLARLVEGELRALDGNAARGPGLYGPGARPAPPRPAPRVLSRGV